MTPDDVRPQVKGAAPGVAHSRKARDSAGNTSKSHTRRLYALLPTRGVCGGACASYAARRTFQDRCACTCAACARGEPGEKSPWSRPWWLQALPASSTALSRWYCPCGTTGAEGRQANGTLHACASRPRAGSGRTCAYSWSPSPGSFMSSMASFSRIWQPWAAQWFSARPACFVWRTTGMHRGA